MDELPRGAHVETEDIRVVLYPVHEVSRLLRDGRITHTLVVAGHFWYLQREGGIP